MVSLNLISILAFKKKVSHRTIPACACTHTQTHSCCLQSKLHQETCLPSMAVRQKIPLLHFYSLIQPLSTREGQECRAAQFNPAQSEITYLSSSTHLLLFQFFLFISLSLLFECVQPRTVMETAQLWSVATVILLTVKKTHK